MTLTVVTGHSDVTERFYNQFKGHPIDVLTKLRAKMAEAGKGNESVIYFAGDSSLDNKAWILTDPRLPSPPVYDSVLSSCVPDIGYWLQAKLCEDEKMPDCFALNTSIEESTLRQRQQGKKLLTQDKFIRDNVTENDVLVVSIGGNDIALSPTLTTVWNMVGLVYLTRASSPKESKFFKHFVNLFKRDVELYITALVAKHKPKLIIPCMIYHPCTDSKQKSWASSSLSLLRYNSKPHILQNVINAAYEEATAQIKIEGVVVAPLALATVLDSNNSADYDSRVEPSSQGGAKMADAIKEIVYANMAKK